MDSNRNNNHGGNVTIIVPQHVSVQPSHHVCILRCHRDGILWRGLAPTLLEAPMSVSRRLLWLILEHSYSSSNTLKSDLNYSFQDDNKKDDENPKKVQEEEQDPYQGLDHRLISLIGKEKTTSRAPSRGLTIFLQPPQTSAKSVFKDYSTFARIVLKTEQTLLRLQTLTAWWATLGGGYFFCRRLPVSLQLARYQRALALHIGNTSMARQCSINEAYNLIYAGKFRLGKAVLAELETSKDIADDVVTLRQCAAARLLAHQLKTMAKRLNRYHTTERGATNHTIDDYQRLRIVEY